MAKAAKHKKRAGLKRMLSLVLITVLSLLLVLAWFYRDELFRSLNDPGQPFQTYVPPAAPDYSQSESWLSLPDLSVDPATLAGAADVFVLAPSLYLGGEHWVAPVLGPKFMAQQDRIVTPNYVMPYAIGGRLYAPRYREAALYSFLTNRDDARAAQDFAYQDVRRAFGVFLDNSVPERPIVLIGHGQGALHIQRLLAEYFDGPRAGKLAAAYLIDHPTPLDILPDTVKPCETETDFNCAVGFGAFTTAEDVAATKFVSRTLVFNGPKSGDDMRPVEGRALLCTNPLLWNRSTDFAPARLHKGGVAAEGLDAESQPAASPRQTSAQCADGILVIDRPKRKSLRRKAQFGGRYRTPGSNLFYEDLRQNMITRISALIESGALPERAPLMDDMPIIDIIDSPVTLPEK